LDTGKDNDIITGIGGEGIEPDSPTLYGSGRIGIWNFATFNTDNGDDIITGIGRPSPRGSYGIINQHNGVIDTGNDNDIITGIGGNIGIENSGFIDKQGTINTGTGDDIITAIGGNYGLFTSGTINVGDGNDSISSHGKFFNSGVVFLDNGNDSIIADAYLSNRAIENFNVIDTGDGNDAITSTGVIYNQGIINTGNGDDSIIVNGAFDVLTGKTYGIHNNGGAIITGDGNDSIIANEGFESAPNSSGAWFLGEGEDYIKGYGSGDFYGGNGFDKLELTPGTYTVGIWDRVVFAKGNSLMLASEFEQLIAGNTTYDFTSLTAGQIIVVS